jgi:phosphoribosylformimino-5-aminoimidazole carboxamide ribotide isomerase
MIAIPAIDLREGACVQLVGGAYDDERVRLAEPRAVARAWAALGFRHLHLVDLDAATGRGSNAPVVRSLLGERSVDVQVGGGIRDEEAVEGLLAAGASRVVVGTRALEEPQWLAAIAARFRDRVVLAVDVRDGRVTTHGWARTLSVTALDVVDAVNDQPLAGILVTAVDREGLLRGPDLPLMARVAAVSRAPVYASGGITTLDDLRALADHGLAGAIVGMALYTGALEPRAAAEEFGK